jgi:hypothetical protein
MGSKPLAQSKPWENKTNVVTYPSKPSKRKVPLKNGPKCNKRSHMCGLERGQRGVLLKSSANVPSRNEEMGQTWSKDLQIPPTNSLKPRNGPSVE